MEMKPKRYRYVSPSVKLQQKREERCRKVVSVFGWLLIASMVLTYVACHTLWL